MEGAIKWGDKQGDPGEKYLYSDTGYIMLGEILEQYFNNDLALALRILLKFEKLGLKHTWLESLEPATIENYKPVRRYLGRLDVTDWDPFCGFVWRRRIDVDHSRSFNVYTCIIQTTRFLISRGH